ncbi:hypothetical protein [Nostoc commune]|uniref:hypothetical protein n=1 Tax=Nostoc commune TaxID=1178 RepID=UPI0018C6CD94|nr:hypothetical protein [Nostoc commune]MBG1261065.1 hypothetical protein [Nostoc commune BAE]
MALRKKTTAPTADTITINEALLESGQNETAFRLALSYVRPDDFDTVKAIPMLDYQATIKQLQGTQSQLPDTGSQLPDEDSSTSELPENSETLTEQPSNSATEQPKTTLSVSQQQQHLASPTQSPTSNAQLTLIDQLARQAGQEVELVDAIAQVKNQLIINNLAVRDAELVESINQRWQYQKQGYLGTIRDLASLAKEPVQITPDDTDLTQEIDSILGELGKKLIV